MPSIHQNKENDGNGSNPFRPKLRLSEKLRRGTSTAASPDLDAPASTKLQRKASSMKRVNSVASAPGFSVTVDLPTLRPGARMFTHSPTVMKQPLIESMTEEEEYDDDSNHNLLISDRDNQENNNDGINRYEEHYNEKYMERFQDSDDEVQKTPLDQKTEFFLKETVDLLNHRNKLLGDLHFISDSMQKEQTPSPTPSSSNSSGIHPSQMVASPSDISVLTPMELDLRKHVSLTNSSKKDGEKLKTNYLMEKYPDISPKQLIKIQNRARHVGSYLETYYRYIEEYQRIHEVNVDGTPKYPEVDGLWNPIQIMRNRRVRMKHGEKLSKVETYDEWRKVRVACKAFSKNERSRLIWYVGLNEIVGDIKWREYNDRWLDMRDKDGKRWYLKHRHEKVKVAMKDVVKELTGKETRELEKQNPSTDDEPTTNRNESLTSSTIPQLIVQTDNNSGKLDEKDVEFPMRLRTGASNSMGSSAGDNLATTARFEHYKRKALISSGSTSAVSALKKYSEGDIEAIGNFNSIPPEVPAGNNYKFDQKAFEYDQASYYDAIEEAIELVSAHRGMSGDLETSMYELEMKDQVARMELNRRWTMMKSKVNEIEDLQKQNRIKYQKFIQLLENADSDVETQRKVIQARAIRIEELLGYCDRTNGEIITSITLKIRNLNEKAEGMADKSGGGKFPQLMYKLVEATIVAILWLVWVIVEIWIWSRWMVVGVVKCIKWVLGV